jgi:2'-hydroxyisoflavone reductase
VRLLVLGGTRFVGRAVVEEALARGHDVTALHRGVTGRLPDGVRALHADRTDRAALDAALGDGEWDAVVDTWSGAPDGAAEVLRGRVGAAAYVSSRSVYRWPLQPGADESAPVVDADGTGYAADKRAGELAWRAAFPDALLLRAGLVVGPYEDVGRLPWWLDRVAEGGDVLAPGRPQRWLQLVDARDLAAFALDRVANGGLYDVGSLPGHASTEELLEACVDATGAESELVWVDEEDLLAAGVEPWTQLPCWVPSTGELAGLMEGDTSAAHAAGLVCRPVEETVSDTWAWLQREGRPAPRADRPPVGLPRDLEQRVLGAALAH